MALLASLAASTLKQRPIYAGYVEAGLRSNINNSISIQQKVSSPHEARRIAANVAKLPELRQRTDR